MPLLEAAPSKSERGKRRASSQSSPGCQESGQDALYLTHAVVPFRLGSPPPSTIAPPSALPRRRRGHPRNRGELAHPLNLLPLPLSLSLLPPSPRSPPSPWSPPSPPRPEHRLGPARRPVASGPCPAWAPVWAGQEAGRLSHRPGLETGLGRPVGRPKQ